MPRHLFSDAHISKPCMYTYAQRFRRVATAPNAAEPVAKCLVISLVTPHLETMHVSPCGLRPLESADPPAGLCGPSSLARQCCCWEEEKVVVMPLLLVTVERTAPMPHAGSCCWKLLLCWPAGGGGCCQGLRLAMAGVLKFF